jgi:hypothetical protein
MLDLIHFHVEQSFGVTVVVNFPVGTFVTVVVVRFLFRNFRRDWHQLEGVRKFQRHDILQKT